MNGPSRPRHGAARASRPLLATASALAYVAVLNVIPGLGAMAHARPPEGGYLGFGLGYAAASGDRGVPLEAGPFVIDGPTDELVRTDFGSGLAFDLRFGWLVGPVAPELALTGHGTFDFQDGAGYPTLGLRFHPLILVDSLADLKVDASVFVGAGYAIGGYTPEGDDDGKGWSGWALTFGLGATYDLSARVRIGFDLRFAMPMYGTFMIDWDDDIEATPAETPATLVILPTLQIVASF